jgi:hypothetical protein
MNILRDLQKKLKTHHVIALLGLAVLAIALSQYSSGKLTATDNMSTNPRQSPQAVTAGADAGTAQAANPAGQNEVYAAVSGLSSPASQGLPPSCSKGSATNPGDLLPKDSNSEWSRLNPNGNSDLSNVNLLQAGYHAGIDTVGSSLRNANLQVRSEPPNPTKQVSPWLNTTIEPDLMRTPLEIGCGPQ